MDQSDYSDIDEDMVPSMEWDLADQSFFWQSSKIGLLAGARDSQIISRPRPRRFMEEKNVRREWREFLHQ